MKKLRNATFFQFKTNQHFVFRYSLIFFSKLRRIKIIFFNVQNILNKMKYNMTKKTLCDFFVLILKQLTTSGCQQAKHK